MQATDEPLLWLPDIVAGAASLAAAGDHKVLERARRHVPGREVSSHISPSQRKARASVVRRSTRAHFQPSRRTDSTSLSESTSLKRAVTMRATLALPRAHKRERKLCHAGKRALPKTYSYADRHAYPYFESQAEGAMISGLASSLVARTHRTLNRRVSVLCLDAPPDIDHPELLVTSSPRLERRGTLDRQVGQDDASHSSNPPALTPRMNDRHSSAV